MHLSHFFKKIGKPVENIFKSQLGGGKGDKGGDSPPATDQPAAQQFGGAASANAGEGVVNFQTKGVPGLQQQKPPGYGNPNAS